MSDKEGLDPIYSDTEKVLKDISERAIPLIKDVKSDVEALSIRLMENQKSISETVLSRHNSFIPKIMEIRRQTDNLRFYKGWWDEKSIAEILDKSIFIFNIYEELVYTMIKFYISSQNIHNQIIKIHYELDDKYQKMQDDYNNLKIENVKLENELSEIRRTANIPDYNTLLDEYIIKLSKNRDKKTLVGSLNFAKSNIRRRNDIPESFKERLIKDLYDYFEIKYAPPTDIVFDIEEKQDNEG